MQLLKLDKEVHRKSGSAKAQINIKGVKGDVLILSDKKYCNIIETSSVNFELKSEAEQDALIETFQSFLNGLGFPIQIVVRIREIDLDHYLDELSDRSKQEEQSIYRNQIDDYSQFVRSLVSINRILTRNFYIVVPLVMEKRHDFDLTREQLSLKTEIVEKGVMRLGMNSRLLNGLEILNLFYTFYNPKQAKNQPLQNTAMRMMHTAIVKENS